MTPTLVTRNLIKKRKYQYSEARDERREKGKIELHLQAVHLLFQRQPLLAEYLEKYYIN